VNAFILTVASFACIIVGGNRFIRAYSDTVPEEWKSYTEFWRIINFVACLFYLGVGFYLSPLSHLVNQ
jgi:hypothetical protein